MNRGNNFSGLIYAQTLKRVLDIISSLVLMLLFFIPSVLVAIAIKLESKGPILADTPSRVGRKGKLFRMFKFRSMIRGAHQLLRSDPKMKHLYEKYKNSSYKLKDDPRITRVGHFIRKYSLDEVPQFLNVLLGDMSLVGPRAYYQDEIKEQLQKYPAAKNYLDTVLQVKPGITGSWQVYGRSEINFDKRIQMDAEYVKKISLWYDIRIILKTPWAMISAKGAI